MEHVCRAPDQHKLTSVFNFLSKAQLGLGLLFTTSHFSDFGVFILKIKVQDWKQYSREDICLTQGDLSFWQLSAKFLFQK